VNLTGKVYQMLRLTLESNLALIPEISANKYMLWVRFTLQDGDMKPKPHEGDVPCAGRVLAVLHDLNLAAAFAPRVALLDAGRVAADGSPVEVLHAELVRRVFGVVVDEVAGPGAVRYLMPRL
jgi:hypothetical protein